MPDPQVDISVVIPVYNECDTLRELYQRLVAALEKLGRGFEIIAVDDGSKDGSHRLLCELRRGDPRLRVVRLVRNFGQSQALYAGFSLARGKHVIMMDADLQVFPEDIGLLVAKLDEGFDMVSGWRVDRHDTAFRKIASRLLNWYVRRITRLPLHDYGCSLKGFTGEVVGHMTQFTHRCRYLPVDMASIVDNVGEVEVRHADRLKGKSKYSLFKLVNIAVDIFTSITIAPLRVISFAGWGSACAGFLMGLLVVRHRLVYGDVLQIESVTALVLFCTGMQLFAIGLMCEYIGRIFLEAQRKPYFIIRDEEK